MESSRGHGVVSYTARDLILYALGIGCTPDQTHELKYLYERDADFRAFPLFPLALSFRALVPSTAAITHAASDNSDGSPRNEHHNSITTRDIGRLSFAMPPFPPPMMSLPLSPHHNGVVLHLGQKFRLHNHIPTISHANNTPSSSLLPITTQLSSKIISIQTKQKGTLVVTETEFYLPPQDVINISATKLSINNPQSQSLLLATSQTAALLLFRRGAAQGHPPAVQTYTAPPSSSSLAPPPIPRKRHQHQQKIPRKQQPASSSKHTDSDTPKTITNAHASYPHQIQNHQALLYRLSGDTNSLHVMPQKTPLHTPSLSDGEPSDMTNSDGTRRKKKDFQQQRPKQRHTSIVLHGLCTLGYAVRSALAYCESMSLGNRKHKYSWDVSYVECKFVKPVYVGDTIEVLLWDLGDFEGVQKKDHRLLRFEVHRKLSRNASANTTAVVVRDGLVEVRSIQLNSEPNAFSKL